MGERVENEPMLLLEELAMAGDNWRKLWTNLDTLGVFDDAYMADGWEAFCHNNLVYWRRYDDHQWTFENNVKTFLLENPPDDDCGHVRNLFEYSRGIDAGRQPWLLFQYIVGIAVTSQGMGLNSLMGISDRDATYLGRAISAYGDNMSIVHPYVELLLSFEDEEDEMVE